MIIPSQHASRVAGAAAGGGGGGGGGSTPNAVNWANTQVASYEEYFTGATQQITGISETISLYCSISAPANNVNIVYYRKSTSNYWGGNTPLFLFSDDYSLFTASIYNPPSTQFVISNVNNNDYISFFGIGDTEYLPNSFTLTIRLVSHSGTVLDTITCTTVEY
jgi:hypothetical protein